MMRACAWDARWSNATLRVAILSRRAWSVNKGQMTVDEGFGNGRSMDTTVISSPSLLVLLLLLSVSVAALVSINGSGTVWAGEGGGGGGCPKNS